MIINRRKLVAFKNTVWVYYKKHKRILPWRTHINPYRVLVSEIMLQQTQVSRVLIKYPVFISRFPNFSSLAASSTFQVLSFWQGLGYNRRALYLRQIAQTVVKKYGGILPRNIADLDSLPGIGEATASSIAAFAFNSPAVFIETNIRRVFIHHFFKEKADVHDREILPIVEAALDVKNPREWYYALMDYGSNLAKIMENPNRKSRHYAVQEPFDGSNRQIRGVILKLLLTGRKTELSLSFLSGLTRDKIRNVLAGLMKEGFVSLKKGHYSINEKS